MAVYTETLTGDGSSSQYRVVETPITDRGLVPTERRNNFEVIGFSLSGTWNSATATLELCLDETASPQVFVEVPAAAFTVDVADSWHIPAAAVFRVTVANSGSPQAALTLSVRGDLVQL